MIPGIGCSADPGAGPGSALTLALPASMTTQSEKAAATLSTIFKANTPAHRIARLYAQLLWHETRRNDQIFDQLLPRHRFTRAEASRLSFVRFLVSLIARNRKARWVRRAFLSCCRTPLRQPLPATVACPVRSGMGEPHTDVKIMGWGWDEQCQRPRTG